MVAMAPVGCVPARALTPLVLLTAVHTLTCCVVTTLAPAANVTTGVGNGVGTGVGTGAGDGAAQPDTVITGTVPADENATAQPAGAKTCSGTVTVTVPAVVVVVPVGVCVVLGVCASASTGAMQSKASKSFPFLSIRSLF